MSAHVNLAHETPMSPASNGASVAARSLAIAALDGYGLAATLFEAEGSASHAALTIIAPAAAVPARYSARFAAYLAERGAPFLPFDYRGIVCSSPQSLRGVPARMRDWSILDRAGVIGWSETAHPARPLKWLSHSMGGFATGLAHNNRGIVRQLNIATLSGYWRRMRSPERYRVRILDRKSV